MTDPVQLERFENAPGFIAALDQSTGSAPRALAAYGIDSSQYANEQEMAALVHKMRTRIMTSPAFTSDRILGAILFIVTLDSEVEGRGTADYLWNVKGILPFLKIDKGLEETADDVQMLKPIPGLPELLAHGVEKGAFGTKERSLIHGANAAGIERVVDQQFELAVQVVDAGLMPIVEPEISIKAPDKAEAEEILKASLLSHLDALDGRKVALKLTIPSVDGFYTDVVAHPAVSRVVALSGGYSRAEANTLLAKNPGVIASFSRALAEGLDVKQSDLEFNAMLDSSIESIFRASMA